MAYTGRSPTYQTVHSTGSKSGFPQQQQPQQHIYEEQPYYVNERPFSRQNFGGDDLQSGRVIYSNADGDYNRSMNTNARISNGHSSYPYTSYGNTGPEQFSCHYCERNLSGSRYILKDEHPYCIKCYEDRFANTCEECGRKIGTDSKDLSYKDRHWHEKCFFCSMCKTPLIDKPFGCKNEQLYCGECYNQQFASRCDKCHQIFKPGTKKLEYRGQQYHEHCFTCFACSQPIGTKSFIPKDQKSYCVPCYEENFATKCTRCLKVIAQGGVTYKNQPWHRECFTCTHCKNSLAGQRFTSRDDHPYCADCFARLFAKKCVACSKPITGVGGTRYISFEERHWHNDCFVCQRCRSSLVGRGFLTDGPDILCPDCGRREPYYGTENSGFSGGQRGIVNDYPKTN
ncbi:unnamed protein product [Rotaria sp. Silwood1]|nr:unnamed protein product [Rotaria sp. Silwood1]CAF1515919.1 unnamed protein product [Rotaria sp. Silwood1]